LPTREITPLQSIPVCYDCHRLRAPIVDGDRQTTLAPDFPATTTTPAEAAVLTRLTTDAGRDVGAKWSPDGSTIAFVSDRSGTDQIWLMDTDGGHQRQLTFGPAKHAWPEWSSDSKKLVYWGHLNGTQFIKTTPAAGGTETVVVTSNEYLETPRWRPPDDSAISYGAVTSSNWDVWVATPDGSQKWRLTSHADMEGSPYWSPDGTMLAYKLAPSGQYSLTVENVMTFENGFAQPTVHAWKGPEAIQMSSWSSDSTQIAYTCEVISGASGADRVSYANVISTVSLQGGEVVATDSVVISKGQTLGDRGAVFSRDGSRVAFWAWDRSYRATLWLYDKATDSVRALTTAGFDTYPQWSPDGTRLVFESMRSGNPDLWVIQVD
jgi:Tol biopolymer transport system component